MIIWLCLKYFSICFREISQNFHNVAEENRGYKGSFLAICNFVFSYWAAMFVFQTDTWSLRYVHTQTSNGQKTLWSFLKILREIDTRAAKLISPCASCPTFDHFVAHDMCALHCYWTMCCSLLNSKLNSWTMGYSVATRLNCHGILKVFCTVIRVNNLASKSLAALKNAKSN